MLSGNGLQMHIQKSAEVIVAARDAAVKDRTECEVLHLESLEEYYRRRAGLNISQIASFSEMMAGSHSFPDWSRIFLQRSPAYDGDTNRSLLERLCFLTISQVVESPPNVVR